ncbi:MAG: HDIG domain-containing protein [Candidatus Gastranaerophilales bacterium]|nr:HDIG domain-containing protein [Candidatus Gastranaerophilales bacterium]
MKKTDISKKIAGLKSPDFLVNCALVILFTIVFTGILVSKYFFFQTIVGSDNTSKIAVIAPKDIEVTDTIKTEKRKREVAQKVSLVYSTADDVYIKNNLNEIIEEVKSIRANDGTEKDKQRNMEVLLDISDSYIKTFVISYLLNADDELLEKVFNSSEKTLAAVLEEGITEKDFEENTLSKIIRRNIETSTTNSQIKVITALLEQVIVPNMIVDEEATELARKNARDSVAPIKVMFAKGDVIVNVGEPVTQVKKEALTKAGYNILRINYIGILGILCLVAIGIFSVVSYLKSFEPKFMHRRYMAIIAALSIFIAGLSVLLPANWSVFVLPFPFFTIILSVFLNPRSSFFITVTLLTIITLSLQFSALAMSVFILSVIVSTIGMTTIKYSRRFDLIKVGIYTSSAMSLIILCVYYDLGFVSLSRDIGAGILNGFVSGIFALGMIPIFENTFKVITMFGLVELGDYNQPLLKKLHEAAPGTFEHSLRVSNLSESAAEAIGADPILARVGALYHDVGKIVRPLFFVENQTYSGIENPHEKLTPRSSKMVITSHTKDGIALAKEYHIPEIIQDFIIQHHGDSLASYFYNQAVAQEGAENVKEEQFRYTGPKPNTKETAILMIADAVESASRTLKDHSQEELDTLINKIIQDRLNDNQLSESPLTLKDIKVIASTLSRVLRSVFHKRIKYQEAIEDIQNKEKEKQKQEKDEQN